MEDHELVSFFQPRDWRFHMFLSPFFPYPSHPGDADDFILI